MVVARPIIHLRGDYLLIVTIGIVEIVRIALINDVFGLTGGSNGIFGISRPMADEETGSAYGLEHILETAPQFFGADDLYVVPDAGSPTGELIEIAEKSQLWLEVRTIGTQCHASTPQKGRNAFLAASDMILGTEFTNWAVLEPGKADINWFHSTPKSGVSPITQWVMQMDMNEWLALASESEDPEALESLDQQNHALEALLDETELVMLLSGEEDNQDAILEIHPGAGGTESQDWAEMLLRMKKSLLSGERIEIRGFGSFKIKEYEGYAGRNPKTGESVVVASKRLPFFRAGKELKEFINQ